MPRIIVDIDNTLWDFASVLFDRLKKIAPTIPPMNEWKWDFYAGYVSIKELYNTIDEIHREQHVFEPFPSAKRFLESLLSEGYKVIIASHRDEKTRKATEDFLKNYKLPYTELHLSHDKSILFDSSIAIVDDAPYLLDKAKQKGLIRTGLRYPWNRHTGHPLFDSLEDISGFLLKELNGQCGSFSLFSNEGTLIERD